MRPSQSLLTLIIKLIILMIFFVCLCFISAFLYSTKYWPDIYNYINANITIERIPTISELKIQIVEVGYDYTTEVYSTTDADYFELSTVDDFDIDEFMTTNFNAKTRVKRNAILEEMEDHKELPSRPIFVDYVFLEEPIEIKNQENNTEDDVIMRTFITKTVIDNLTELIEDRESDDHTSIHKSNIEEPNRKLMNINIGTESDRNEKYLVKGVREYLLQLTTTVEGYLVGEEIEGEVNNRPNEEPLHMTTDNNENEHDEETNFNLLKDLADVSKLTTRSPEDVEMVSEISDTGHHDTVTSRVVVIMRSIILVLLCGVFICVQSECDDVECAEELLKQILEEDDAATDLVDLKLEVPGFKQVKNVEIKDVNDIILGLTKWFQHRLNESFIYKSINNNTKIFVKKIDFNVDFEHGNAHFDMGLAKQDDVEENSVNKLLKMLDGDDNETTTVKAAAQTEVDNESRKIAEATGPNNVSVVSYKQKTNSSDIYNTIDFDTTYYDENEDKNSTDYPIIDYIEMYKDTTVEERLYTGTELPTTLADFVENTSEAEEVSFESLLNDTSSTFKEMVFPWVATIFIKNLTDNSQFQYYCDGALLSEKVILTGGRCVHHGNGPVPPEDILVFLGKGNLQSMGGKEKLHQIKNVIVHFSFTTDAKGNTQNDLAILIMEESATFNDRIQSSCIHFDEAAEIQEAATTAWGQNGQLLPIVFEKEKSDICFDKNEDIFCATYGPAVPLCPSYGGVYVAKRGTKWCLEGIFYGDPAYRELCINKNVLYTSLRNYFDWIDGYIMFNTNKLN